MRKLPSLNALRAFEATGRLGRMTLAANELAVTHSAISRQVKQLEEVLGVDLLEGPKNRLRMTDAGERLLGGLVAAFDQMDGAVRAVADPGEGPLDVSCPGTFTMRWLIPRLYRFRDVHPQIEVRLSASSLPVNFQRDGFDVAIRAGQGDWGADVLVTELFAESTGPVLAPVLQNPVLQNGDPDFSEVKTLHTRSRKNAWHAWADRTKRPIPAGNSVEYEHFYYMIEAALSGLGMCIAPWPLVADDVRSGRLVAPYGFTQSGQSYVALRRARPHRKAALFCDWLVAEAHLFASAARQF